MGGALLEPAVKEPGGETGSQQSGVIEGRGTTSESSTQISQGNNQKRNLLRSTQKIRGRGIQIFQLIGKTLSTMLNLDVFINIRSKQGSAA